ncbi:hypothetical protein [Phenylobacterium sp.]|nr:hypothetical protein [Phenylobacterium sp.]
MYGRMPYRNENSFWETRAGMWIFLALIGLAAGAFGGLLALGSQVIGD